MCAAGHTTAAFWSLSREPWTSGRCAKALCESTGSRCPALPGTAARLRRFERTESRYGEVARGQASGLAVVPCALGAPWQESNPCVSGMACAALAGQSFLLGVEPQKGETPAKCPKPRSGCSSPQVDASSFGEAGADGDGRTYGGCVSRCFSHVDVRRPGVRCKPQSSASTGAPSVRATREASRTRAARRHAKFPGSGRES